MTYKGRRDTPQRGVLTPCSGSCKIELLRKSLILEYVETTIPTPRSQRTAVASAPHCDRLMRLHERSFNERALTPLYKSAQHDYALICDVRRGKGYA